MSSRGAAAWFILSFILSALLVIFAGVRGDVAVHWSAGGDVDLALPAWIVALIFPALLALLLSIIAHQADGGLIGHSRTRTGAVVALVITAAQTFIVRHSIGLGQDPLSFAVFTVGVMLVIAGNFWAKDLPDPIPNGHSRRTAGFLFVAGLAFIAVAAILGIGR